MFRPKRNAAKKVPRYEDLSEDEPDVGGTADDWKDTADSSDSKPKAKRSASAKQRGGKSQKRRKVDPSELPVLSVDILTHVMEMLLPREILKFASLSKAFQQMVTHKHAIHAGLVAQMIDEKSMDIAIGGWDSRTFRTTKAKKLDLMMTSIASRTVYIPTPLRMLRLMCGTKCERQGCVNHAYLIPRLMLHVCCRCASETNMLQLVSDAGWNRGVDDFPWLATARCLWTKKDVSHAVVFPICDPWTGDRVGPRFTSSEAGELLWKGKSAKDHEPLHKDDVGYPTSAAVKKLTDIFEDAKKHYASLREETDIKRIQEKQLRDEKKRVNTEKVIKKIKLLKELFSQISKMLDPKWKSYALSIGRWNRSKPHFNCYAMNDVLSVLIRRPESISESQLQTYASIIDDAFQQVYDQRTGGWLEFPPSLDQDPVAMMLRCYLDRKYY